ncbi:hypothetical protein AUC68_10775 [Methyloceanibacter methanicus]|uniref:Uncharacterized protein n=1 Tax=Methyloceanibacter methanicus TaxID=1774968 RepID=A0A1E3VWR6_9HYPH|nr:hypothetical protein AUC68_10775 [Methyloceanibacter methanicus]
MCQGLSFSFAASSVSASLAPGARTAARTPARRPASTLSSAATSSDSSGDAGRTRVGLLIRWGLTMGPVIIATFPPTSVMRKSFGANEYGIRTQP